MSRTSGLTATSKAALEKFIFEGKEVPEIAELMEKPVSTIYRWLRISGLSDLKNGVPWRDESTGLTIPPHNEENIPMELLYWELAGVDLGMVDDEAFSDPQGIWSLATHLVNNVETKELSNLSIGYLGPKNGWRKSIREITKRMNGLYGCRCKLDTGTDWLDPFIDEPAKGMATRLKDPRKVRQECEKLNGEFVSLEKHYDEMLTELISDVLGK